MFTVALVGPDGSGKTTVGRLLEGRLPLPAKYIYMGINAEASNHLLPTTRLWRAVKRALGLRTDQGGPRDRAAAPRRPRGPIRGFAGSVKSLLALFNRLAEESYRQALAWAYIRRGCLVLFDRHYFLDYYAYDIAKDGSPKSRAQRIHGFFLNRIYRRPDLVIFLDAPADVLLARKQEGTLALLEQRRADYLALRDFVPNFIRVDASRGVHDVAHDVREAIWQFCQQRQVAGQHSPATSTAVAGKAAMQTERL